MFLLIKLNYTTPWRADDDDDDNHNEADNDIKCSWSSIIGHDWNNCYYTALQRKPPFQLFIV